MELKFYGCSRAWVQLVSRCLALMMLIIILSARPSYSTTDGYPLGKQDEKFETWTFHSKIDLPGKDGALYLGMFFCSGTLYFLKGNFAHIFWLDTSTGKYTYENNIFFPPFEKVTHCEKSLNEKFHDSFFRYNARKKIFLTYASFTNFCAKLTLFPEKDTFDYDQICQRDPEGKTFDWYMFPRMNIEASLNGGYDLCASGQGHFQHFWGEKIDESGDWIVAHLDSGYDIIISDIPPSEDDSSMLPEEYILISDPDGKGQKISSFEYSVHEWAQSGNKGKKYPVHISVRSVERDLSLDIRVLKKDQTSNLLGVEKWFGYADIEGRIDNKPQKGWAFFIPVGIKEK
ncbi:MAG: lipocalin family protein [Desulfobacteraceae bacterium]|nr:hypothetical protein [Desulfobacteraceae bacterium]MBC2757548.1 lipocalin family protein [Desulfobacteraceae bacterium]